MIMTISNSLCVAAELDRGDSKLDRVIWQRWKVCSIAMGLTAVATVINHSLPVYHCGPSYGAIARLIVYIAFGVFCLISSVTACAMRTKNVKQKGIMTSQVVFTYSAKQVNKINQGFVIGIWALLFFQKMSHCG